MDKFDTSSPNVPSGCQSRTSAGAIYFYHSLDRMRSSEAYWHVGRSPMRYASCLDRVDIESRQMMSVLSPCSKPLLSIYC